MTDNKISDADIKKALECCHVNGDCRQCPYSKTHKSIMCILGVQKDALDLINRKDAEIERLEEEKEGLLFSVQSLSGLANSIKSEAYKEFEGRALDEAKFYRVDKGYQGYLVWIDDILKIKKELTRNLHRTCTEGGNEE